MKKLVIAEKPSVAKDIANVLNCKQRGQGFFEGDDYIVSWAIGHLITLFDPEDYNENLKKWYFDMLPIIPEDIKLKPIKNTQTQLTILKKLMNSKETDYIICATDSGREGELIFRYIYDYVKCKKDFKRLWISSMTNTAIKEGFDKIKDGSEYDNLYVSAKCRSEADWLVGINATRAYTIKYNSLLSIGRVQTPTLAILTNRQNEIDNFKPVDYFEIKAIYNEFSGLWFDHTNDEKVNSKILDEAKANDIADKIKNKEATVFSVTNEKKKQPPPLLFDLTELQRECNRKFGYPASKTLSIAQSLYESKKLITYPRTDSKHLSHDMIPKINSALNKLNEVSDYEQFVAYVKSLDKLPITKRIVDDKKITDHHAIIPTTKTINLSSLTKDEYNVYNLIALRFIAAFYPSYVYNVTKIVTICEDEHFLSKGTQVVDKGYTVVYGANTFDKDGEDQQLPEIKKDDKLEITDVKFDKKKTSPPKQYNEATLLSAMENAGRFVEDENLKEQLKDSGLGTPATRASIIERIISVGYVNRKGKLLVPTDKAIKLIAILPEQLISPETTGKWEKGLSSISKGNMTYDKFMSSIKRYVDFLIDDCNKKNVDVQFEQREYKKGGKTKSLGKCPLCDGGAIFENRKAFFCSNWKNENCKFSVWKNSLERYGQETITPALISKLLKNKEVPDLPITQPQTLEKGTATLILKQDMQGVELKNFTKL